MTTIICYDELRPELQFENALKQLYYELHEQSSDEGDDLKITFTYEDAKDKRGRHYYKLKVEMPTLQSVETGYATFDDMHSLVLFELDRPACGDFMRAAVNLDSWYIYWF